MNSEEDSNNKAILVIFILFICQANIKLLAKVIRTPLFYQSVKLMTIFSLVIGDLILVFFPLGVRLVFSFLHEIYSYMFKLFQGYNVGYSQFDPPCGLLIATSAYSDYLLHFVYSFGLIVLGMEVLFRKRIVNRSNKTINALIASSFPWIIGLVIVLPECFTNVDYEQCEDKRDFKFLISVSVLCPVLFTLFLTIVFNCIKLFNGRRKHQINHVSIPLISSQRSDNSTHVTLSNSRDPTSQHYIRQYNSNQDSSTQQSEVIQDENEDLKDSCERRKELKVLAFLSIVFFIMIVPLYAYYLAFLDWRIDEYEAIEMLPIILGWLVLARSFVTPSIIAYFF